MTLERIVEILNENAILFEIIGDETDFHDREFELASLKQVVPKVGQFFLSPIVYN